jgi:hypothetical protein
MKYHLKFWGGDVDTLLSIVNLQDTDYFFGIKSNRDNFKRNLESVMQTYNLNHVVFAEYEGDDVDKERIVVVTLKLPNGDIHTYEESFGYGYPVDGIYFMYEDGSYSCDCNKSLQLMNNGVKIEEFNCGDEIELVDLRVELR